MDARVRSLSMTYNYQDTLVVKSERHLVRTRSHKWEKWAVTSGRYIHISYSRLMHGRFFLSEIYRVEPCHLWSNYATESNFKHTKRKFKRFGSQSAFYFTINKFKSFEKSSFETGHFLHLQPLVHGPFRPFSANFLNSSFSAIYCRSVSNEAYFWCICDA